MVTGSRRDEHRFRLFSWQRRGFNRAPGEGPPAVPGLKALRRPEECAEIDFYSAEINSGVGQGEGSCDDGRVNRPIGYWIKRLDAGLEAQLVSTLARLHLTRRQWQVVNALHLGPLTPAEVGNILLSFNSADDGDAQERDMAALVRNRLVFLLDGRLALTEAGAALQTEASGLVEDTRRELTAGIGEDEYAMAVSVLERMSRNAERLAAG